MRLRLRLRLRLEPKLTSSLASSSTLNSASNYHTLKPGDVRLMFAIWLMSCGP